MRDAVIAVVEDDAVVRVMIGEVLADDGYRVRLWSGDEDALTFIGRVQPDLLVLDLWVGAPRRGWQLLERLRAEPQHATLPVIVCSGDTGALDAEEQRLNAKRCATLPKPFELDHMLALVQRFLDGQSGTQSVQGVADGHGAAPTAPRSHRQSQEEPT